jgi:hypothetical protein
MYGVRTVLLEITVGKHGEAKKKERAKRRTKRGKREAVNGEPYRATNRFASGNKGRSVHVSKSK